jgi:hypothetical protein
MIEMIKQESHFVHWHPGKTPRNIQFGINRKLVNLIKKIQGFQKIPKISLLSQFPSQFPPPPNKANIYLQFLWNKKCK